MNKHELYPTLVCTFEYEKHTEFKELFERKYKKYGHYDKDGRFLTGEHYGYNQVQHEPTFEEFYDYVAGCAKSYIMELNMELDNFYLALAKSWFSFCDNQVIVPPHSHADHHLSFIYYVNTPENCQSINFHDYRPNMNEPFHYGFDQTLGEPPNCKGSNRYNDNNYHFIPKEGELYIFPSKLIHSTTHMGDQKGIRQAIAGDFALIYKNINNKHPFGMYQQTYWKFYQ